MKKFVALLTKQKRLSMNVKMMTLFFFEALYSVCKKLRQFFLHTCSLTCSEKDTSPLLKVVSIKTMVFTYYVYADNPFNKIIKFQKNKNTHRTPFHA